MNNNSRTINKKRRGSRQPWWQSPVVLAVGFLAVALAIAAAISAGGDDTASTDDPAISQTSDAEVTGAPLPPYTNPDTGAGALVPSITAASFDGTPETIAPDGTARLYGFFAHWCPHCQDEMPVVADWLEANQLPEGVEVVAISTGTSPDADNYPPSAWFGREDWPTTVVADSAQNAIANGFGLTGYPYWVAVDGNGQVIYRVAGQIGLDAFEAIVDTLATTGNNP